ncbi:hypothetical protein FJW06_23525 [Mesorhizobium sp. B4-1-3]|uniref:hypothetical protein n=1 Tax=Mesorhizobium sp. B4-1-3 TaxID=2589889 RepID=UPI001126452B|nr:hypothetical protein [Mesorhizobium sp. B4-1-3]TPI10317.1 hypothetical protein FJW06_23525 [Mesorhizobium sp. B4-1-3]
MNKQTSQNFKDLATTVSCQELDWRAQRGVEGHRDLRAGSATRNEWVERNRATHRPAADFNRQLSELRQYFGAVCGARDVIQDMKRGVDELRRKQGVP